jgi:hypothetical protein
VPTAAPQGVRRALQSTPPTLDLTLVASDERMEELKHKEPTLVHKSNVLSNATFTVDILSVGSVTRLDYMEAQIDTWGSHGSVRSFWGLSENDDFNSTCEKMTEAEVDRIVDVCTSHIGLDYEIEKFVNHFYTLTEGYVHRYDAGWLCAQRRVARGLGYLLSVFDVQEHEADLPDFLLVVDDDTYFDIGEFEEYLIENGMLNSPKPQMVTGCVIEANDVLPYSFPYGGFALAINKEAIKRLYTPLYCDGTAPNSFIQLACESLEEDRIGERALFRDGMSLMELFHIYAATTSFCMHSDWLTGYMANYYNLSEIDENTTLGGIKSFPDTCGNLTAAGTKTRFCDEYSGICHNQGPKQQEYYAEISYNRSPQIYKHPPMLRESSDKKKEQSRRLLKQTNDAPK